MPTASALPNAACPLCGGANGCAVAASGRLDTPCWCSSARFGADLLARVPEAQRRRACICAACVRAQALDTGMAAAVDTP